MNSLNDDFFWRQRRKKPCQIFKKLTSGLLCCLAFLPTETSAVEVFLPDSGGEIFQLGLSVDVTSNKSAYRSSMVDAITETTRAVSGEPENVFVTEFGWNYDNVDATNEGYCLVDSSSFDWESYSHTGPMADYAQATFAYNG